MQPIYCLLIRDFTLSLRHRCFTLLGVLLILMFTTGAGTATATLTVTPTITVDTLPILWEAGGHSAGNDSAGQAARVAVDTAGNVAVASGPSLGRDLAVTSYTQAGVFRWRNAVTPTSGVFLADWVAAAPNGDLVAVGHNISGSSGNPIGITLVRFGSDGALQWRVNLARTLPAVGRLLVDSGGNAYLAFNSVGDGQDIQLHKYSPAGALIWSQVINTGFFSNNIATSLALSPDETEVAISGDTIGGAEWITALYDTATGTNKWLVVAPEGLAARDLVVDATRVYVTGQGNAGIDAFLTVVAYDRTTGQRLWRTDKVASGSSNATGLRMAIAPDGSVAVAGQTTFGFLDWYLVVFETTGDVRWEAVRDGGLNTNEIPTAVFVLPDGTIVLTGPGGPNLPGGYIGGVTAGFSPNGIPLWEAFSRLATVWAVALPNGDVCATGGYDAYIAAFRPTSSGPTPTPTATIAVTPTPTPVASPTPTPDPTPSPPVRPVRFDFDGDRKSDISVFRPGTGVWYIMSSASHRFIARQFGLTTDRLAPADYDGDGRTDLAVYRASEGMWYILNSSAGTMTYARFGVTEDIPIPADRDGDGRADITVFRPSNGNWYWTLSSTGAVNADHFGVSGDVPTHADFDGDGRADLAVFRPSTSIWYRLNAGGTLVAVQFGMAGDRIVPADFDGDGMADIAVFRPETGMWYMRNSSDESFAACSFGMAGDVPVAADYDGDGLADAAVFRPSNGYWYILPSSHTPVVMIPWGESSDLPIPSAFGN